VSVDWIHRAQDLLNVGFVKLSKSQFLAGRRATNFLHPKKKCSSAENLIINLREAIGDKMLKGVTDWNLEIMMSRLIYRSVLSR
jgi:hypothetical protein